ncbi:hypothetical protein OVA07_13765 [Novosphingobium sp. SL115]|uniref:hypothetical protein n=1 Tax=Novosphingobium sp. SL115 TaxID=2995150 RepID=UPI0022760534|nr:hypothetical protein [Novosphingobium sp. SL115]MCY1672069.1 hypothetical protein [Novosphingobium sp. SL115]
MTATETSLAVALVSSQQGWAQGLVASLPRSLRCTEHAAAAQLAMVDGRDDWPQTVASLLAADAQSIALVEPCLTHLGATTALVAAIDAAGADCAVLEALASNPALVGLRDVLTRGFGELVLDGRDPQGAPPVLLRHIRLLRACGATNLHLKALAVTDSAFLIDGQAQMAGAEVRLRLTGVQGHDVPCASLTAHAADATARLVWHGGAEARPAQVSLADASGLRCLPAMHEGGHRHGLRALLADQEPTGSAVMRALIEDMATVHNLLGAP